ncbi:hypothetical protein BJ912DRAFT_468458 [Pholiota molesta]|nr:hypothetical protein BJ912DRAFT_468458 [Pholiota molesta]
MGSPSASASSTSTVASSAGKKETTPTMTNTSARASKAARHRPPSSHSSGGSSDQTTNEAAGQSLFLPPSVGIRSPQVLRGEYLQQQPLSDSPPPSTPISLSRGRRTVIGPGPSISSSSRQNSLGEHDPSRPNTADMQPDTVSSLFRVSGAVVGEEGLSRSGSVHAISTRIGDIGSMGSPIRDDSGFYPFQSQSRPQLQHQHRATHEHGYLAETGLPEQLHTRRHPPQVEQSYQQFHPPRNVFTVPSQYGGAQNLGRDMHSLSRVSMRSGTPQGPAAAAQSRADNAHGGRLCR